MCHGCGHISCSRNAFVDARLLSPEEFSGPGPTCLATGLGDFTRPAAWAGNRHASRRHPAGTGGLAGPAHRRCSGISHAAAPADRRCAAVAGAALCPDGSRCAGTAGRSAARPLGATGAVARSTGAEGQYTDSGESPDAFVDAVRGLGVLRQAGARAPGSVHATAGAGEQVAGVGAEPDFPGQLRCVAGAFLALGVGDPGDRRIAGVLRRGAFFRRCLPPVQPPCTGNPSTELHRNTAFPRGLHQGGEAVRLRAALAAALSRHLYQAVCRGSPPDLASGRLGFRAGAAGHDGVLPGVWLDRHRHGERPYHPGADDHVPGVVQAGAECGQQQPYGDRRPVRRRLVPGGPVRLSGLPGAGHSGRSHSGREAGRRPAL